MPAPSRGLTDRGVVVTRDEGLDGPLSRQLTARGALVHLRPTLEFLFAGADSPLAAALARVREFDWLLLTSARAVEALRRRGALRDPQPAGLRVAAVGPGTAAALASATRGGGGWRAEVVPDSGGAEALLDLLRGRIARGERVLFPASAAASPTLPEGLRELGAEPLPVVAYRPAPIPQDPRLWRSDLEAGRLDALTLTSPSSLEALLALPGAILTELRALPTGVQGPTTAAAVREAGWRVVIEAEPTTFKGLVSSLSDHFGS